MSMKNIPVLDIVSDHDRYLKFLAFNSNKQLSNYSRVETITIPKYSFTAFKINESSIDEIATSSDIVLLGGIPDGWFRAQRSLKFSTLKRVSLRRHKRRFNLILYINGKVIFNSNCPYDIEAETRTTFGQQCADQDGIASNSHSLGTFHTIAQKNNHQQFKEVLHGYHKNLKLDNKIRKRSRRCKRPRKVHSSKLCKKASSSVTLVNDTFVKSCFDLPPSEETIVPDICLTNNNEGFITKINSENKSFVKQVFQTRFKVFRNKKKINSKTEQNIIKSQRCPNINSLKFLQPISEDITHSILEGIDDSHVGLKNKKLDEIRILLNSLKLRKRYETHDYTASNENQSRNTIERNDSNDILYLDKMLVMVKTAVKKKVPSDLFSDTEPFDTRIAERWKEYIVVARKGGSNKHIKIQFFRFHVQIKSNKISSIRNLLHRDSLDFYFKQNCLVKYYSLVDKTISIQKPNICEFEGNIVSNPLTVYIFKCSSLKSSMNWFNFLQIQLQRKVTSKYLQLYVPQLEYSISIKIDNLLFNCLDYLTMIEDKQRSLVVLNNGYWVFQNPFIRYVNGILIKELKQLNLFKNEVLSHVNYNVIIDIMKENINFEQFNLLNDILTSQKLYNLEMKSTNPQSEELNDGYSRSCKKTIECEGFMIQISEYFENSKMISTRIRGKSLYLFTNENILFFLSSYKAVPPFASNIEMSIGGYPRYIQQVDNDKIRNQDVYVYSPYMADCNNHINWLNKSTSIEDYNANDRYAYNCYNRRLSQILKARNILDIMLVRTVYQGSLTELKYHKNVLESLQEKQYAFWKKTGTLSYVAESIVVLENNNGTELKLLASSPFVARHWVENLIGIRNNWIQKVKYDTQELWKLRLANQSAHNRGRCELSNLDMLLYSDILSLSKLSFIQPVIFKGILFQKPKRLSNFTKYYVMLLPGYLILYSMSPRSVTGFPKLNAYYHRNLIIPLNNAYLYSGMTTEVDLLRRDRTFNELNPGNQRLPRVYGDGWRSSEGERFRTFTIWISPSVLRLKKSKSIGSTETNSLSNCTGSKLKNVDNLLQHKESLYDSNIVPILTSSNIIKCGQPLVFMARSQEERDMWICVLSKELERFNG